MSTELKVGAVVLIALGIFAYFIIQIEDTGVLLFQADDNYEVKVVFDTVGGMADDAPVRLAGVRVGQITSITIPEGQAVVTMEIARGIDLHEDAVAFVASRSVLGENYLELNAGTPGLPEVPKDGTGVIASGRPVSVDQMVAVMNDIAADISETASSLSNVFGTEAAEARMQRILENMEVFSSDVGLLVQANREAIGSTLGNVDDLTGAMSESLPPLLAELRALVADLAKLVAANEGRVADTTTNLKDITASFGRSASELEEILSKVNRGDGTIARLINEPETIDKMNSALDTVDDSLAAADTFFNRVGQTQFSFSLRSEFYEQSEATKSYFGFRVGLGATGDRAFVLSLIDDNVGAPNVTSSVTEIFGPGGELLSRTLQRTVERTQDFRFSALLALRFYSNWQLRAGLMESEAGGGLDYFPGSRWRLTFEAWDFGRDPDPHLKFWGSFDLWDRLFVIHGRQAFDDCVQEIAGPLPRHGAHRDRLSEAQLPEVVMARVSGQVVLLVHRQQHRPLRLAKDLEQALVQRMHPLFAVHQEQDQVCLFDGSKGLGAYGLVHGLVAALDHAAGVHDEERPPGPVRACEVPVPGDAGLLVHDGHAATHHAVEERGLAYVGPAYDRHHRKLAPHKAFSVAVNS